MSRKLLSVLLVCAFLLPAAMTVSAQAATCTGDKVTLTVDDWSSADRVEYMNQVIDAFQKDNPCVTVSLVPAPSTGAETRRLTLIASGTAPDLIATGESWIPLYSEAGGFLDLKPFITGADGFDPATVFQEAVYNQGF
ncbi:MAG: extracellular solute-binding protein, partial [Chloroflexota bacterium]